MRLPRIQLVRGRCADPEFPERDLLVVALTPTLIEVETGFGPEGYRARLDVVPRFALRRYRAGTCRRVVGHAEPGRIAMELRFE